MADCCCPGPAARTSTFTCAECQAQGSPVDLLTVKALLTEVALQRLEPGEHRFCPAPSCEVVYFDRANHTFTTHDLRVPVWQKAPPGTRLICYCFGENEANIQTEVERTGASAAVERVRQHIAAGRCACEVRNPKGACCLGDVTMAVARITPHG
jgi:hypothetical protein